MSFNVDYIINLKDNATKSISKLNGGADKLNSKFGGLAKTVGRGAALVGIAGGAALAFTAMKSAVDITVQFERKLSELQAVTGATEKEMVGFENAIMNVSRSTKFGAREVADAFGLVGSAKPELLSSARALGAVTEQAIILSKASGMDLNNAASVVTKSLNQYGKGAESASKFVDILATSQQKGTARIEQLGESFKNAGSVLSSLGIDFDNSNALLQAMAKGGLEGAEAGTALSSILGKLTKSTNDKFNPALTSVNDVINNLADTNLDLVGANKLVGVEMGKNLLTLVAQKDVVNDLTGALSENGNALAQAATRFDNLTGDLDVLSSQWEGFVLSFKQGEGVLGRAARSITQAVSSEFERLNNETIAENLGLDTGIFSGMTKDQQAIVDVSKRLDGMILRATKGVDSIGGFDKKISGLKDKLRGLDLSTESGRAKSKIMIDLIKGVQEERKGFSKSKKTAGIDPKTDPTATLTAATKTSKGLNSGIDKVTSSAPKTFNINIENLVKDFKISTTNMAEGAEKTKDAILQTLIAAVNDVSVISK